MCYGELHYCITQLHYKGVLRMSADNGRCAFEHLDYCCPPEYIVKVGFKCSRALPIQKGDIAEKCGCPDDELMTEEEWEAQEMDDGK
jgi:hypothetical protein